MRLIQRFLTPDRSFEFWKNDDEFYRFGAKAPRSSCILDSSKLLAAGVKLRPAEEALEESLTGWHWATQNFELIETNSFS